MVFPVLKFAFTKQNRNGQVVAACLAWLVGHLMILRQACAAIGMIGINHPNGGRNHPKDPCHWDEIIPMDGGWLPHWDEALDESTKINEALYFMILVIGVRGGGLRTPPPPRIST